MNRTGVVGTVLLLLLVLGGCSSDQVRSSQGDPRLDRTRIGLEGIDGRADQLRLLGVAVASPGTRGSLHIAGDSAALLLTITNGGRADDVLTSATTDVADEVVLRDGDAAPDPDLDVPVRSDGAVVLRQVDGPHLELSGLRELMRSGHRVPITFHFRDAGPVTLQVPVNAYSDVRPDRFSSSLPCCS
ncbi:copper chaperone PCu(A)C [Candidatus Blastococcus massiliensis]|uniref:copper chaperone PCu(A)C n=1 Tax=Candidatus Blastococcus massiliensis TaxID=1470358 RepID=UPI0004B0BF82|nr:copper chaperone PCu(A)C [Candidatus Blastococcus massiliensis]